MTFPPSSAEEIEAARQRGKVYDAKIAAAKLELERRKAQALPIPLPQIIPERARKWIRRRLRPFQQNPASAEAIEEAQVEYQWAIYDRSNLKRPLYPRKRAISPSNQAFRRDMQKHNSQKQSDFFKLLPPEIRAEVYRKVFGQLVVEIEAHHPTFRGGPPPSDDHVTFWMSKINDAASGGEWGSALHVSCHNAAPLQYIPHIVPLLQTCRQIYAEAIVILYSESVFKNHGHHNSVRWTKYLLHERLQMIRTVHFQLNIGYPWQAPTIRTALEGIAGLKNLQKLCVVGFADLVDLKPGKLIDAKQWKTRKHLLLPFFRGFSYIREVDIFLPIMHNILIQENDESVLGSRLHGLTVEQRRGREDALCACVYFPEKLGAPPLSEAEEVELNQGI